MQEIPYGYCHCGCGQKTSVVKKNNRTENVREGDPRRFVSGHNIGRLDKSPTWKGGRNKTTHGYVLVRVPDHPRALKSGYVYEHVLVAEKTLGRPLPKDAVVHHLNHNKQDNRPENLLVCKDQKEHFAIHQRERALKECGDPNLRQCTFCKAWDKPENLNRLTGSAYHKECARLESKRRYDAGLAVRDREKVAEYNRRQYKAKKAGVHISLIPMEGA